MACDQGDPPPAPDPLELLARAERAEELARIEAEELARAHACHLERVTVTGAGDHGVRAVFYLGGSGGSECLGSDDLRPGEALLRIPELWVDPSIDDEIPVGAGGLRAIRVTGEEVRLVLDEAARADVFHFTDPPRVLVDVSVANESTARPPIVLLDPGHGGNEFGGRFEDLKESTLVLDITRRAAAHLRRLSPETRVVLTRETDVVVGLEDRAARANALDADLFVSIHLNAADEAVRLGGITTFVLDTADDLQARRLAARENGTRAADVTGLQRLLAGFHRHEQLEGSRRLAEHVHAGTLQAGRSMLPDLPDRGVRSALFYVLVGARMPAVLLEASFLTKPEEAAALRTEEYRDRLARGIATGIAAYLAEPAPEP